MTVQIIIPSNPADLKKIQKAVKEADDCLIRIDGEKEQIKAILETLKESFPEIPSKYFSKMIRAYHKQNIDKLAADTEDTVSLYEAVVAA